MKRTTYNFTYKCFEKSVLIPHLVMIVFFIQRFLIKREVVPYWLFGILYFLFFIPYFIHIHYIRIALQKKITKEDTELLLHPSQKRNDV